MRRFFSKHGKVSTAKVTSPGAGCVTTAMMTMEWVGIEWVYSRGERSYGKARVISVQVAGVTINFGARLRCSNLHRDHVVVYQ